MNTRQEEIFMLVNNLIRFNSLIKDHTLEDELCGDHVVMSSYTIDKFMTKINEHIMNICKEEFNRRGSKNRYEKAERPLLDAILLMNKLRDGDTNKPKTDNDIREVAVGETCE